MQIKIQNDQLDGLLALKVVAEKRNFTVAAGILGVSPSAISQTIRQLERRLGVALLSRTTRSTIATEAGERFLTEAGPALEQILNALQNLGSFATRPSGLLRLNLSRAIYSSLMAPIIRSFCQKYPEVGVELYFDDELSDVVGEGFDAGIRLSEMMARDMVSLRLYGPLRFVASGSPSYFKKHGRPRHPRDLLSHDCIRLRVGPNEFYDRWEFEEQGKDIQVQVKGTLIVNDPVVALAAAVAGEGITYSSYELNRDKFKSGELEMVLKPYAAHSDGYYLYYPTRSQVLPKLRAFIDHLKEFRPREVRRS